MHARGHGVGIDHLSAVYGYVQQDAQHGRLRGAELIRWTAEKTRACSVRAVLVTNKSFSNGSKTIGVVSIHVLVGPACVLVYTVTYSAWRSARLKRSFVRRSSLY